MTIPTHETMTLEAESVLASARAFARRVADGEANRVATAQTLLVMALGMATADAAGWQADEARLIGGARLTMEGLFRSVMIEHETRTKPRGNDGWEK